MPTASQDKNAPTLLLIAASRGLGLAIAAEFLKKNWNVVATIRADSDRTQLKELATRYPSQLEIETLDICQQPQVEALHQRLSTRTFDILFINAGVTNKQTEQIGEVSTEEFTRVMVTNALCPMRAVETFEDLVAPNGLIGIMSSGQGSIANNTTGMRELYRGSKAALNQFMRSYAARNQQRALLLAAPGWVRTEMGGPEATLSIDESIPNLVNVLIAKQHRPGLEYLDYQGRTVPW